LPPPKILITHPIHPGQFGALARALCDAGYEVLFLSRFADPSTSYRMVRYEIAREPTADGDPHLTAPEHAVLIGQAVGRVFATPPPDVVPNVGNGVDFPGFGSR